MLDKRALRKCPSTTNPKKVAALFNAVNNLDVVLELSIKNYNHSRLCIIDINYKNKPFGRMFIQKSKNDYNFITLVYATNSWRKSNLFDICIEGCRPIDYCNYAVIFEDKKKVQNYFGITEYQNNNGIVRKIDFILRESKEAERNKIAEKKIQNIKIYFQNYHRLTRNKQRFCQVIMYYSVKNIL